ncbi:VOC family protein [Micromonospora narathiwatensis]|uniref:Catechol 2,3-dioxygenase n=1 Tax=Micromonospora narathiwatensis TaxID=299146 RepID=A0A1A8ZBM3_9ACTN|nr:VOC family protein [Micromonospora narathiwatensis]SBT41232.1 Catechol 2,3-dioxygenase [Micromonospora narathiwatensis]
MITNISIISLLVKDIDAAKAFYLDVLGFVEQTDITVGGGAYRWCTITHPTQPELQVQLTLPGPPYSPEVAATLRRAQDEGSLFGLGLDVDDCRKTYEELRAKGVEFIQEPAERPYGVEAVARDNSGNWLVLVERRGFDPAAMG